MTKKELIRLFLTFTVIPVLISIVVVLFWANGKIKALRANYEKKLEIPVKEMEELNRIAMKLQQFSVDLQNIENKKFIIEKAIQIYRIDMELVQKYLQILKENKTLKGLQNIVEKNLNHANEALNRLNKKAQNR